MTIPNIDPHKVDKYLPKLLNGEAYKLETYLPNLLSTGNIIEREKYDYRTSQFRKKDQQTYNSKVAPVWMKINQLRTVRDELIQTLWELKQATDLNHEKNTKQQNQL
jgi:hypothetical protein